MAYKFITIEMLEEAGACDAGMDWVRENLPNGAEFNEFINALDDARESSWASWLEETFGEDSGLLDENNDIEDFGDIGDADSEEDNEFAEEAEDNGHAVYFDAAASNTNQNEEITITMSTVTINTESKPFQPITVTSKAQLLALVNDIENEPKVFQSATLTFNSESEFHDVVAALAAYGRKTSSVSGTGISQDFNLGQYSGNARRTVNALLPQLKAVIV
jgi:hypothetical protein